MGRGIILSSLQNDREYLYEALVYVAKGIVQVMAETFPLDDMNTVYDKVVKGELRPRGQCLRFSKVSQIQKYLGPLSGFF